MLFNIQYQAYKSGNAVFNFLGSELEFKNMVSREGGIFTLIEKTTTTNPKDIERHASIANSFLNNPFDPESELAKQWDRAFQEYNDFVIQQNDRCYN